MKHKFHISLNMVVPPDMIISVPVKNRGIEDGFGNDIMAVLVVTS